MFKGSNITFKISCDCSDNPDNCTFKTIITLKVGSCQSPNGTVGSYYFISFLKMSV